MARKRQKNQVSKTVHMSKENVQFVAEKMEEEERDSFSQMANLLISRARQQEARS